MYDENDPVARYYDYSFALGTQEETEYFKSIVNEVSGPVADLCCGTGILSLGFSTPDRKIYAVDSSSSMLEVLKSKLTSEDNIEIVQKSMTIFSLPETVQRIICRDAFFHNLTPNDQRSTLKMVHSALSDNGIFAFNIHVPNPRFLSSLTSESARNFSVRGKYQLPNSENTLAISQKSDVEYRGQVITTFLRFETYNSSNELIGTELSSWKSRYTFPYEMFYLLELTGFEIRNAYGNYDFSPWNENTMLIIEARKLS